MCILVHAYLYTNSFVYAENVFWTPLQNAGKRSDLSATASSGTPMLSLFNTEQRRHPTAAFSNNNAVSFLDQSTQHFDIGPYKPTLRKHLSNIGSNIYVACLIATFVLFPIYRSRLNLRLAAPKFMTFPSPFYISVGS